MILLQAMNSTEEETENTPQRLDIVALMRYTNYALVLLNFYLCVDYYCDSF